MDHGEHKSGVNVIGRAVRIVVPWIGLGLVVLTVWSLLTNYRVATQGEATGETTETVTTQTPIPPGQPYVTVLTDGLNLRTEPSTSSAIVVALEEDQQLLFIEEVTGWYHVRTADGAAEGWVAAGGRYSELVRP